jgi:riboflavin biosynthesis pyrimidine reductase
MRKVIVANMMSLDGFYTGRAAILSHGLLDELHLLIGGRVVGGGTPVFEGEPPASLELLETRTWDGSSNVLVRYAVRAPSG